MERAGTGIVSPSPPHPSTALHPRGLVVHHKGAGTSAAVLRAGFSSVVVPFFGDQPSWVWRPLPVGAAPPTHRRMRQLEPGRDFPAMLRPFKHMIGLQMDVSGASKTDGDKVR